MTDNTKLSSLREEVRILIARNAWRELFYYIHKIATTGEIFILFPQLKELDNREAVNGVMHKNVWEHTLVVVTNLYNILLAEIGTENLDPNQTNAALLLGALLHDIGKVKTRKFDKAKKTWTYYRHEEVGFGMMKKTLDDMGIEAKHKDVILNVIRYHQLPGQLEGIGDKGLRRFCAKVNGFEREILLIAKADATSNNPAKVLQCRQKVDDLYKKIVEFKKLEEIRLLRVEISNTEVVELLGVDVKIAAGIKEIVKDLVLADKLTNTKTEITSYLQRRFK